MVFSLSSYLPDEFSSFEREPRLVATSFLPLIALTAILDSANSSPFLGVRYFTGRGGLLCFKHWLLGFRYPWGAERLKGCRHLPWFWKRRDCRGAQASTYYLRVDWDMAIILKRANRDELFHGNFAFHHRKKQLHTSCYYGPLAIPFRIGQIGRDNRRW